MAKKVKHPIKKLNAIWNITEAAVYIDSLKRKMDTVDLLKIYRGNFVPMLYDRRLQEKFKWDLNIEVIYLDGEMEITENMEWQFDTPMTFAQMLKGNKEMFVVEAGIKVLWQGVSHEWTNYVNKNLVGKTIVSAWAVATTESTVKPLHSLHRYSHLATKLNKDFKTGYYL